ncbi:hypothetical protein N7492_005647 [Penicillium capsulatum]|uniref:Uncharacterized protein n=1 Tax=Penicillium capsulatum TaxID=69766 RepID=A0A9W9I9R8_9EURO|nr:hypothetical protein N7492_005647 [Penicillium capsulatum]KAJ6135256.1 hypothetical protein N7512_000416 [Penicillium capsulatum]
MPHLRHHRRHHSWPHCGSELCMSTPRGLDLRVSKPGHGHNLHPQWSFQQAAVVPLVAEEMVDEDDAQMAGITRTPSRIHRMWSRPLHYLPPRDPPVPTVAESRTHVHRSVLRRLIRRPPLDKTRSLFVMPTTMTAGDRMMISGWMPPRRSAQPLVVSDRARTVASVDASRFAAERRHRRCHSEQPRSWREPSAGLWTLKEE